MSITTSEELLAALRERPDAAKILSCVSRLDARLQNTEQEIDKLLERLQTTTETAILDELLVVADVLGDEISLLEDERKRFVESFLYNDGTEGV